MQNSLGSIDTSVKDLSTTLAALVKRRAQVNRMIELLESFESGQPAECGQPSVFAGAWRNSYQQ